MPRLVEHICVAGFDLDGTLVDTAPDLAAAANAALSALGHAKLPAASFQSMIGDGVDALMARALARSGMVPADDATLATAAELMRRHYAEHLLDKSRIYPGVAEGLRALARDGVELCVVTNKASAFTLPLLAAARLAELFSVVLCADRTEDRKPAPNLLTAAFAHFGVRPRDLVYVGDSGTDVGAARAAGCPVVLVDYGYGGGPPGEANADAVIGSIAELAALPIFDADSRATG